MGCPGFIDRRIMRIGKSRNKRSMRLGNHHSLLQSYLKHDAAVHTSNRCQAQ